MLCDRWSQGESPASLSERRRWPDIIYSTCLPDPTTLNAVGRIRLTATFTSDGVSSPAEAAQIRVDIR